MKAERYPKARFCCMKCGELLPLGAETCPNCEAVVAEMNFTMMSNIRGALKVGKEAKIRADAEYAAYKQEQKELEARQREWNRPVAAVIVDSRTKSTALGNAILGGMIAGRVGAFIGAATGSTKTRDVTFSVKYNNGTTKLETVRVGSKRYEELARLLVK